MTRYNFQLVDVFTDRPFGGNQLAVFPHAEGMSPETMQSVAREFNFSECTFVFPPQDPANDFQVRIFTPGRELPTAGHPTVGTAFALARNGMIDASRPEVTVRFEEGVGPIPVALKFENGVPISIKMTQPLPRFGPTFPDPESIADMLSLDVWSIDTNFPLEVVSCGVPFLYVPLRNLEAIQGIKLRPDIWERVLSRFDATELFIFTMEVENPGSTVHSRMLAPAMGIAEDPATGIASGPLGCYLVRYGLVPRSSPTTRIVSEQGIEMGRPSFIEIEVDTEGEQITGVRISGQCHYMGEGYLDLE
jgi:trans-2,3-dihydro-3-hydroxyanthranilate isomerase